MKLEELLNYDDIVVQCHNNPDADAIASGYGVYCYLKSKGKDVRLVYGGSPLISKSNILYLIKVYDIPIDHVMSFTRKPSLLLTCDCQYGNGNVQKFEAETIATIDHHQISGMIPDLSDVRPGMGSCSTIVWDLLRKAQFEIDEKLATILYYGLYMDTNAFADMSHPLDKDMYDLLFAQQDRNIMKRLVNMNITLDEARIAGQAIMGIDYDDEFKFAIVEVAPCDQNLLGLISDFILTVDTVDVSVVYSIVGDGVRLSIRSCESEVKANELARFISTSIGSGGGHINKAGGFLDNGQIDDAVREDELKADNLRSDLVKTIIVGRLTKYFSDTTVIYAGKYAPNFENMTLCERLPRVMGYVIPSQFVPVGTSIIVRTITDDIDTVVNEDTVIMIGTKGRIFLTDLEHFNKTYIPQDCLYTPKVDYFPTIRVNATGASVGLEPFTYSCMMPGGDRVYVRKLNNVTKVFGKMTTTYTKGDPGDYLAIKENEPDDVFIINRDNFKKLYQEI